MALYSEPMYTKEITIIFVLLVQSVLIKKDKVAYPFRAFIKVCYEIIYVRSFQNTFHEAIELYRNITGTAQGTKVGLAGAGINIEEHNKPHL